MCVSNALCLLKISSSAKRYNRISSMSYQVLARKYRPQRFSEVIGQEHVTRTLKNAIEQQRIAHGYIFSGHRGHRQNHDCAHSGHGPELPWLTDKPTS